MTCPDRPDRILALEQEVAMPLAPPGPEVVRFGDCALDLLSGELIRDGNRCLLPDQPFRILALLLRHPGSVVTREDLRREVWPDKTFVVAESPSMARSRFTAAFRPCGNPPQLWRPSGDLLSADSMATCC